MVYLIAALVIQFCVELDRIKKMSGSLNEQTIRPAFRSMLRRWATSEGLFLLEEHELETKLKTRVYPDGTIVHDLRVPLGYWEAKDTKDDLDAVGALVDMGDAGDRKSTRLNSSH